MKKIIATCNLHGHELQNIEVLNPGDCCGKTWLIEIGGGYSSLYLIVEARSMSDAVDELAESEKHSHHIVVEDEYLSDYDAESCHHGPSRQILDLDHVMIYGEEGQEVPLPCRYYGKGLPEKGVLPSEFCWDDYEDE